MSDYRRLFSLLLRSGVQRKNRFQVEFALPDKLLEKLREEISPDIQSHLSLVAFDTQIPSVTFQTNDLKVGFPRKMPYEKTTGDFSLTFICTGDMLEKKVFEAWEKYILRSDHTFAFYDDIITQEIKVSLMKTDATKSYVFSLLECWPQVVGEIQLQKEEENTFPTLQVNFAVWKVQRAEV